MQYASQMTIVSASNQPQPTENQQAGLAGQHFALQSFSAVHNGLLPSSPQFSWMTPRFGSPHPFPSNLLSTWYPQQP